MTAVAKRKRDKKYPPGRRNAPAWGKPWHEHWLEDANFPPLTPEQQTFAAKHHFLAEIKAKQACRKFGGDYDEWLGVMHWGLMRCASKWESWRNFKPGTYITSSLDRMMLSHLEHRKVNDPKFAQSLFEEPGLCPVGNAVMNDRTPAELAAEKDLLGYVRQKAFEAVGSRAPKYLGVLQGMILDDMTLNEVAAVWGVTRERIRQILNRFLIILNRDPALKRIAAAQGYLYPVRKPPALGKDGQEILDPYRRTANHGAHHGPGRRKPYVYKKPVDPVARSASAKQAWKSKTLSPLRSP